LRTCASRRRNSSASGTPSKPVKLLEAAEGREQKFAAESERLTRLLQNDRDRYTAALKEEQERSAQEREPCSSRSSRPARTRWPRCSPCASRWPTGKSGGPPARADRGGPRRAARGGLAHRQIETPGCCRRAHRTPAGPAQDCQRRRPRQGVGGGRRRGARARAVEEVRLTETARAQRAEAATSPRLWPKSRCSKSSAPRNIRPSPTGLDRRRSDFARRLVP
jgi:hypothetical protein